MMAKTNEGTNQRPPFADLNADTLKQLDDLGKHIDTSLAQLDALEEIGVDQSRLREKLEWGRKVREILLKDFTQK